MDTEVNPVLVKLTFKLGEPSFKEVLIVLNLKKKGLLPLSFLDVHSPFLPTSSTDLERLGGKNRVNHKTGAVI